MALIEHPVAGLGAATSTETAERAARRALRDQIARLERELSDAVVAAFPFVEVPTAPAVVRGPRLLDLGELERVRDDLAGRLATAREAARQRGEQEAAARARLEAMLQDPAAHKWAIVRGRDLGERVCAYQVRPRLGLLGMLMGWWQVKVSSGCPLGHAAP